MAKQIYTFLKALGTFLLQSIVDTITIFFWFLLLTFRIRYI